MFCVIELCFLVPIQELILFNDVCWGPTMAVLSFGDVEKELKETCQNSRDKRVCLESYSVLLNNS